MKVAAAARTAGTVRFSSFLSSSEKRIANAVNEGKLVPEDIIFSLLSKRLEEVHLRGESGFILDGIPRTQFQAPTTPSQNEYPISNTLFVGNLSFNVGKQDVSEFFNKAGKVVGILMVSDQEGNFRGFGYVEFSSEAEAEKAMTSLNDVELMGRGVRLDYARPKSSFTLQSGRENNNFYQKGGQSQGQSLTLFVKGFDSSQDEHSVFQLQEKHRFILRKERRAVTKAEESREMFVLDAQKMQQQRA